MNIKDAHADDRVVSTFPLFKGEKGNAIAIRILKEERLKEHTTPIPALLVCITGHVIFEDEKGLKENLLAGDYIHIEPTVRHWVDAIEESHLILVK